MTGASGFVGQHVCSDLLRRGYAVRAVTRNPVGIPGIDARFLTDLRDVKELRAALRGAGAVIHLAGRAHVMSERAADSVYRAVNVEGTRAVAEAAAAESVAQVIFASSVKAVGEGGNDPISDDTPERPQDAYGRSKLEAEQVLYQVSRREGLPVTVLRFPLVYGPGVKGNVRRLFDAVWRGFPIPIGGARNARSMLGIHNALAFIGRALQNPLVSARPFLLSDGGTVSTEGLIAMIAIGLGRKERIVKVPSGVLRGMAVVGDVIALSGIPVFTSNHLDRLIGSLIVDSSRAWREAGITPPVSLDAGLAETAVWYRDKFG